MLKQIIARGGGGGGGREREREVYLETTDITGDCCPLISNMQGV